MSSQRSTTKIADDPRPAAANPALVTALARSAVHRKLPVAIRQQVDQAILMRPKGLPTLESISAHFDLPRYHITLSALRAYARRLEDIARPAAAGQVLAVVLGSLPPSYRRGMRNGTEVLLLSRMAQMISSVSSEPLSVAELARLGPVLAAMSRHHRRRESAGAKRTHSSPSKSGPKEIQPTAIKGIAHDLYGVKINIGGPGSADLGGRASRPPSGMPEKPGEDGRQSTRPAKT